MNGGGGWQGSHVRSTHCRPWPEKGPPGHSLSHAPCAVEISTYQPWRWATHSHPIPQGQARWLLHSLARQTQEACPEQISFKISAGPLHPSAEPLLGLLPGLCLLPSCAHVYGCMCACTWVGGHLHVLVCVCVWSTSAHPGRPLFCPKCLITVGPPEGMTWWTWWIHCLHLDGVLHLPLTLLGWDTSIIL